MITIVDGDSTTYAAYAFGTPHQADIAWCQNYAQSKIETFNPWMQERMRSHENDVFNTYNAQRIHDISRSLKSQTESDWFVDEIRQLNNIDELRNAPPAMIEWVMACPELRTRYHDQSIAAFDEDYVDQDKGGVGDDHYFYRVAMEGLIVENTDGDAVATEWFDELRDPTHELSILDKAYIQSAWAIGIKALTDAGKDPTSRYGADL